MTGCDDNFNLASNMVLDEEGGARRRRRRNIDTRQLVVQHNNKVGVQVCNTNCYYDYPLLFTAEIIPTNQFSVSLAGYS